MKNLILLVLLAFAFLVVLPNVFADQYVRGYTRSNGTYVNGYYRSDANDTQYDNYSTQGNVNPYTGEAGHKRAYY